MTYVANPFKSPIILSFCPGLLGIERGLERVIGKLTVAAYVEIEAFIIANLLAGMESGILDPAPVWTDAKTFDASPFCGKVHGIIGGYPCPGESLAGLRERHLYKGFLWSYIRKAIAAARPLWCFFENVDDHLTGTYPIIRRSLQNLGYAVEEGIFSSEEVGSTCERKRLFILALANADSLGTKRKLEDFLYETTTDETKARGKEWKRHRDESVNIGSEMEHTIIERSQTHRIWKSNQEKSNRRPLLGSTEIYPMPQGFEQYEWEPARIESRMVYNLAGYNFREDLVRAIGNMVDENTAELAFRTLLKKHIKNHHEHSFKS